MTHDGDRRRRDRCPGVLEVHEAADGGLARVRLPGGRLSAGQLEALADATAAGNGLLDLTARANVQIRGLGGDVSELLAAAGLVPAPAHERVRNIVASPLAGRHPAATVDAGAIVDALDRGLCADPALAALPGRFLFVVEDGSGLLAGHDHDVALAPADGSMALVVAGLDSGLRGGAELALAAARAFLAEGEGAWRVRELAGGPAALLRRIGAPPPQGGSDPLSRRDSRGLTPLLPPGGLTPLLPGALVQRDGRVAVTALAPLGRLDERRLRALARLVGPREARISPWRTITLVDLAPGAVARTRTELERLGLVLDPASGWHGLTACAGLGACDRALVDVRAAAAARATIRTAGAPDEHWSACPRRCGERAGTPIAVAAEAGGVVVRDRRVRDVSAALEALR